MGISSLVPYVNMGLGLGTGSGLTTVTAGGSAGSLPSSGDPDIDAAAAQYAAMMKQQTLMGYQTAMSGIQTAEQQLFMQQLGEKAKAAEDDSNQAKGLAAGVQL